MTSKEDNVIVPSVLSTTERVTQRPDLPAGQPGLPRPRLTERIECGLARGLVLVGAGAGYGKTTLLREWVQQTARPAYWYTLQPADRAPGLFLDHLLESMRAADGRPPLAPAESTTPLSPAAATAALAAELAGWGTAVALVLDDYQAVAGDGLPESLDGLLRTRPANLHLVIAGRALPALAPDHLLAWGGVTALGPRDLAFTAAEATAFFAQNDALQIDAATAQALWAESAGWIAGLLLRASVHPELRDGALVPAFSPAGPLARYLQAEVWEPCPEALRAFLLASCLSPASGATPVPYPDAAAGLDQAPACGLFLEAGGDGRYRGNPLFRRFLRAQLPAGAPLAARSAAEGAHRGAGLVAPGQPPGWAPVVEGAVPGRRPPAAGGGEAGHELPRLGYSTVVRFAQLDNVARWGPPVGPVDAAAVQVQALGPGRVYCGGAEVRLGEWGYRQVRKLFFYLFFQGPVSKAQVGACFWPGRHRRALSQVFHAALYRARQALGDRKQLVCRDGRYGWNPAVPCWCDVREFTALLDQVKELSPGDPRALPLLEQALALYRGDLLEEFEGPWWLARREELAGRQRGALLRLGELYLDAGRLGMAQRCYQEALARDGLLEAACQGLLRCYRQAGDGTAARQVYERFRQQLWQERRREPWPATTALVDL